MPVFRDAAAKPTFLVYQVLSDKPVNRFLNGSLIQIQHRFPAAFLVTRVA